MEPPLDDISFLANSENRVAVFESVVEAPRSHNELREEIDASRVTIARILRELEARDWIEHTGQTYRVTPLGDWVCDEFTRLLDELAAEHRLREVVEWLPTDLLPFDIRCLRDAEIIIQEESDTTALIRRIVDFHRSGERVRGVARGAAPVFIENHWELSVQGNTRVELVLTPEALDAILNHPTSAQQFQEMLMAENADYSVYDDIPISVGIVDGFVGINLTDEQGVLKGGLVSENETVYEWAVDLFETCRGKTRPLDPDTVPK
jgi:predicted transcriptional regulator